MVCSPKIHLGRILIYKGTVAQGQTHPTLKLNNAGQKSKRLRERVDTTAKCLVDLRADRSSVPEHSQSTSQRKTSKKFPK